jgi:hypothetical protein
MFCGQCGAAAGADDKFCQNCGKSLTLPSPGQQSQQQPVVSVTNLDKDAILKFLKKCLAAPQGGLENATQFIAVALVLWLFCLLAWRLFAIPGSWVQIIKPGYCGALSGREGTFEMFLCSSKVAAEIFSGPFILCVLLFLSRNMILKLLVFFAARIPDWLRCLLFPATCTIFFGISWSAMHLETSDAVGIVSQRSFPALVGLITFVFLRFGNLIPGLIQPILNKRDVIPFPARALLTIAIPFFLSLVMNYQASVTNSAEKEQEIVLLSMVLAHLALVPNRLQAGRLQTIANSVRK